MNALLRKRLKGIAMVIVGGSLWGISGTVAQVLFQRYGFQAGGLVTIRLLCAGILLLVLGGDEETGNLGCLERSADRVENSYFWFDRDARSAIQLLCLDSIGQCCDCDTFAVSRPGFHHRVYGAENKATPGEKRYSCACAGYARHVFAGNQWFIKRADRTAPRGFMGACVRTDRRFLHRLPRTVD